MEKEPNLKIKNVPQLWVFLAANILILCGLIFPEYFKTLTTGVDIVFMLKALGVSIAPLLLFLLNGLISSHQKAVLVFWKLRNPLPGSEAFSKLSKNDTRIDRVKLKDTYGSLPKSPVEQNKLWYKIYKKNSSNIIVSDSHRAFLLARDLTSLCILFVVFLGIPILSVDQWPINLYYFLGLLLQYIVVVIGAQNRGRRLVTNVLAIESCQ
ncbi:hypothetical protein [Sphingobacterium sp. DR205]|uniref:hypothetical protein n=1 Tax=Sphingobacterium sp. DR205 TaxID=2713573 RepID=UPI0013E4F383|nr:hypothetical protein [Sphingobacterium sp. DR205]QIH33409.1 hypothetical protein G6053_11170 [Sphingobacterium sp. DR205]